MIRVLLFDRFDNPIGELSPNDVFGLTRTEEINGEHSLTITTSQVLEQGWRVLTQDDMGTWREHVVYGTDALHDNGDRPVGTYYCVWSVQPDLMGTRVSKMPGVQTPVTAAVALAAALSGTSRWRAGTVTNTNTGGASMYDTDGWDAMSTLVGTWGGEINPRVEVGNSGVTARKVDYFEQQGDQLAKRRFDFGADLKSVRRKIADGPLYCRITPRGKGEETDTGGYGRKITIADVNDGKDYLVNGDMVDLAKLPDGSGGWEYPTLEVENSDCETPAELLAWAQGVLEDYTTPDITYEVNVLQLGIEGVDMTGVSLGDAVHIVDRKFGDGLRLSGRVVKMTRNMLMETDTQLTIGHIDGGLAGMFGDLRSNIASLKSTVQAMNGGTMSTADYLGRLLDRLNTEINATGGYTYVTEGQGIKCYDTAVSDPLVGAEASAAVEIKGGTIRIANSKTSQGEWDWKTVFTSGHVAAEVVTAAQLTSGYIGSASGDNYWNLDTGEFRATGALETVNGKYKAKFSAGSTKFSYDDTVTGTIQAYHDTVNGDSLRIRPGVMGTGSDSNDFLDIAEKGLTYRVPSISSGNYNGLLVSQQNFSIGAYTKDADDNYARSRIGASGTSLIIESKRTNNTGSPFNVISVELVPLEAATYVFDGKSLSATYNGEVIISNAITETKHLAVSKDFLIHDNGSWWEGITTSFRDATGRTFTVRKGLIVDSSS